MEAHDRVYPPERKALNAALAAAQGEFPPIPREREVTVQTRTGSAYTFKYAPLDTIIAAIRPALAKHGLAVIQRLENPAGHPSIRTEILHADGEAIAASFPLGDIPDSVQALGSRITYLRRYALCALLCLAAEDDDDGGPPEPPKPTRRRAAPAPSSPPRPAPESPPVPGVPEPPQAAGAQPAAAAGERETKPMTEPQKRRLFALFTRVGLTERGERLDYAADVIGRPLESAAELTRAEAGQIIDQLEAEPPLDDG